MEEQKSENICDKIEDCELFTKKHLTYESMQKLCNDNYETCPYYKLLAENKTLTDNYREIGLNAMAERCQRIELLKKLPEKQIFSI